MLLRVGYDFVYECPQPTPMILMLNIHYTRVPDIVRPDHLIVQPAAPITAYRDAFGNWCNRIVAPRGETHLSTDAVLRDSAMPDAAVTTARQHAVQELPDETLVFLLGSRYCDTDRLLAVAWAEFDGTAPGWPRVQAICDFVHRRIAFGYEHARPTRTAAEAYEERRGVCRDYAHLAVTLCRCMNIPARYCTGYLSDVGLPPPYGVMDFAAWFEVYIGGAWHVFDPRNNRPLIGRVLIARGRDAADVALVTSFGPNTLKSFAVHCDEVSPEAAGVPSG
jgi:transglutaminase-like putative cysteine protease